MWTRKSMRLTHSTTSYALVEWRRATCNVKWNRRRKRTSVGILLRVSFLAVVGRFSRGRAHAGYSAVRKNVYRKKQKKKKAKHSVVNDTNRRYVALVGKILCAVYKKYIPFSNNKSRRHGTISSVRNAGQSTSVTNGINLENHLSKSANQSRNYHQ